MQYKTESCRFDELDRNAAAKEEWRVVQATYVPASSETSTHHGKTYVAHSSPAHYEVLFERVKP